MQCRVVIIFLHSGCIFIQVSRNRGVMDFIMGCVTGFVIGVFVLIIMLAAAVDGGSK